MATENDKLTKPDSDKPPIANVPGTYKDDVESIPPADRLQESSMPMAPKAAPFKLGPLAGGERK